MKAGILVVAAMSFAMSLGMGPDDNVQREGAGTRRAALDKMELKASPDIWSDLSDWTNGSPVTAESTKGKVVVIATWSSFYKVSHAALTELQKISDRYGKEVVVVGIHHEKGWDGAKAIAESAKIKFPYAHDASGKVRSTLQVDQDPDFYIIDRSGNMRYSDVVTASVDKAVAALVKETPDEAASLPTRLAEAAAKATREANKTKNISGELKPGQVIDVAYPLPDAAQFSEAKWPEKNTGDLAAKDVQGSALPIGLGTETWLTKKVSTQGRILVVDFWATWCGPCKRSMPLLDELYRKHKQDAVILGLSDEDQSKVETFIKNNSHSYPIATDTTQAMYRGFEIRGIPHVAIVSTDGIVRWQGHPMDPKFREALTKCIEVDPGVASRRKAETEYLKKRAGN